MSALNLVCLLGNFTRDPELSFTPRGKPVCKCGLAVSNKYVDKDNKEIDKPLFIDVVIWNKPAEATANFMKKGSRVYIQGRLELDQWEHEDRKFSKIKVIASKIIFLETHPDALKHPENLPDANAQEEKPGEGEEIPF